MINNHLQLYVNKRIVKIDHFVKHHAVYQYTTFSLYVYHIFYTGWSEMPLLGFL